MKFRACDKCGEVVARIGFISTAPVANENGYFARCNNRECQKRFSRYQYEKLKEEEL